jgi:hypothetical protein
MWPFRKRIHLFSLGFQKNESGNVEFELTEEEQKEVEAAFKMLKGVAILKDYADAIQKATTARALSQYAMDQISLLDFESDKNIRVQLVEKAVAASFKACNIYPLPIFDYDLARLLAMAGRDDQAKELFHKFLNQQKLLKPNVVDQLLLKERDVEAAIKDAENRKL